VLVRSIAAGDKHAMQILFARHNVRIFRFLLRFVADKSAAEDLVSEVFLAFGVRPEEMQRSRGAAHGNSLFITTEREKGHVSHDRRIERQKRIART
jgi:DNA-directed RNA polymerase specialized sigma24 family protein